MSMLDTFRAARRASTPLLAINTPDPAATIRAIRASFNGNPPPVLQWDIVNGMVGLNDAGSQALASAGSAVDPVGALQGCLSLPPNALVFFHNMHRIIAENGISQAIWNLRDPFKANRRTLVLLAPALSLPVELEQDVVVLDEPLPTEEQLVSVVNDIYRSAGLDLPDAAMQGHATDALIGLAAFPAEQVAAMSITPAGLEMDGLWERKRKVIEQAPGLSVWRGKETFDDIGGCQNIKTFLRAVLAGREAPRAVVFLDEVEKAIAGTGTDTSGVTTEMTGTLLTWMQDREARGILLIGPAGTSKSMLAKATGNTGGIPTIAFDLGGMKSSLVGDSGAHLRQALKVVDAVSQGRTLFIGTCNSIGILPPELRRRFTFGTFYVDLPTAAEREQIWKIYTAKYAIADQPGPMDEGWTGAEVKQCCELASRLGMTLLQAAAYIVPVARSAADQIQRLREQASGRFISANYPGVYQYNRQEVAAGGRALQLN